LKLVAKWFKENVIDVIDWPPYSPNLNPIEHAWVQLKETLHKRFPEIAYMRGSKEEVIKKLSKALVICWNEIAPAFFKSLINSIEERCDAIIEAKGWHTRF
jgi:transposase